MYLLIDKPKGITSHDVVDRLRIITGERKIGHAGTLDPNATGLLIIGVGRNSTKNLWKVEKNAKKEYLAEMVLGEERDTDDSQGKVRSVNYSKTKIPTKNIIKETLKKYLGEIFQTPPDYSSVKLNGRKAYQIAREGGKPALKQKKVVVYLIKLTNYSYPTLKLKCVVSSGTYIRSLARDIGRDLNVGGYLSELRRKKIGKYSVLKAVKLREINFGNWKNHALDAIMN